MKEETKCYCGHTTYCDCGPEQDKIKNIHIIPTDYKYSRLYFNINDKEFQICEIEKQSTLLKQNRHVYITNDEEIKEGDYFYQSFDSIIHKCYKLTDNYVIAEKPSDYPKKICKKIILTTDQDLIKDGVQSIDDEFLEWFVKNPSCEKVDVEGHIYKGQDETEYKIIIPSEVFVNPKVFSENGNELFFDKEGNLIKEEPKQENLKETLKEIQKIPMTFKPKQETTLEEFIESQPYYGTCTYEYKEGIEVGAKWQKEQILDFLYSEITERRDYSASKMCEKVIEFIEQYKNK